MEVSRANSNVRRSAVFTNTCKHLLGRICPSTIRLMMMATNGCSGRAQNGSPEPIEVNQLQTCSENKPRSFASNRPRRPTMIIEIIVSLVLAAALASALAWSLIVLLYIAQLRSRASGQRTRLARDLGISTFTLKNRKVVGFFHPFW